MDVNRVAPPAESGERETLRAWLAYQRDTLAWKCSGLSDDQLRERAVPPSNLSLLGLVRHMADVERSWFRRTLGAQQTPYLYIGPSGDRDVAFTEVDGADVAGDFATWRTECRLAAEIEAATVTLETVSVQRTGRRVSLRWIMIHMIEEYARHNGHADLIRERIDGATGE